MIATLHPKSNDYNHDNTARPNTSILAEHSTAEQLTKHEPNHTKQQTQTTTTTIMSYIAPYVAPMGYADLAYGGAAMASSELKIALRLALELVVPSY
jgi:hypothetical protein